MPNQFAVTFERNIEIPMRDGIILRADVYRPAASGQYPVLVARLPYDKTNLALVGIAIDPPRAAGQGYVVVLQDTRGRCASDGTFTCFQDDVDDGYDTVEWLAAQPWSNGNVGMFGASYFGYTQWLAAIAAPPHLKAICPNVSTSDAHESWVYQGGAFAFGFNTSWPMAFLNADEIAHSAASPQEKQQRAGTLVQMIDRMSMYFSHLPVKDFPPFRDLGVAPYYQDWVAHPDWDDYWQRISIDANRSKVRVPAYSIGGWWDVFLGGTLRNFTDTQQHGATEEARKGQKLLVGPWLHGFPFHADPTGEARHGLASSGVVIDEIGIMLRFFDYWLKGIDNGIASEPPVRLFVMGDNVWRDEWEWPLARTQYTEYYFHSSGGANSASGNGSLSTEPPSSGEPSDSYLYDPRNPVPTRGGDLCCWDLELPPGAFDQRPIEARQDVLVYTTPPLEKDLEVTGPITVTLFASSSARDTDFTGKLVDVLPDGYARNLTEGIIRARYREGMDRQRLLTPGEVNEYTIDLWATSNVFKAGHRLRVEISSSNFPRFDRNPNTGHDFGQDDVLERAVQEVFHDASHPSRITLPMIPRA